MACGLLFWVFVFVFLLFFGGETGKAICIAQLLLLFL